MNSIFKMTLLALGTYNEMVLCGSYLNLISVMILAIHPTAFDKWCGLEMSAVSNV